MMEESHEGDVSFYGYGTKKCRCRGLNKILYLSKIYCIETRDSC
jgi:hypothetical protein